MRLLVLFLRTRQTGFAVLGLSAVATFVAITEDWLFNTSQSSGAVDLALIPVVLLTPLISASVISVGMDSPIGELENTMSSSVSQLRGIHLAILGAVGVPSILGVATVWDHPDSELMVLRNLAGFTGIALISAWLIGGRLSWIPPLAFAMLSLLLGHGSNGQIATWAWPIQPVEENSAVIATLALLVIGAAVAVWRGARSSPAD